MKILNCKWKFKWRLFIETVSIGCWWRNVDVRA